ncbi:hypothetical protein [Effusibacillus pohliae]|uniref:hypothetical protein n=1 Tax=Effusibacillus pohliae TaxID=232270 RepID=UPI000362B0EB|nr:hypothetical protein [Effusibacillus pohliae]
MAKEPRDTGMPPHDLTDEINEIAEYLELQVGPVTDAHKKTLAELVQRYGTAAVTLTLVAEMNQLDMVTALLQQSKEVLKKRKR